MQRLRSKPLIFIAAILRGLKVHIETACWHSDTVQKCERPPLVSLWFHVALENHYPSTVSRPTATKLSWSRKIKCCIVFLLQKSAQDKGSTWEEMVTKMSVRPSTCDGVVTSVNLCTHLKRESKSRSELYFGDGTNRSLG